VEGRRAPHNRLSNVREPECRRVASSPASNVLNITVPLFVSDGDCTCSTRGSADRLAFAFNVAMKFMVRTVRVKVRVKWTLERRHGIRHTHAGFKNKTIVNHNSTPRVATSSS
jgi:hypothetical protein